MNIANVIIPSPRRRCRTRVFPVASAHWYAQTAEEAPKYR